MTLISSHFRWIFMVLSYRSDFNVRRFKLRNHYIIERLKIMLWESDIQKIFWNSDRCDICIQTFVNNNKQTRLHHEILSKSYLEFFDSLCTFRRAIMVCLKTATKWVLVLGRDPQVRASVGASRCEIFRFWLVRGSLALGREIMSFRMPNLHP